jgi:hypothetical protein
MLEIKRKRVIESLKDINIITFNKRDKELNKMPDYQVIPEQKFNLGELEIIVSGYVQIKRTFDPYRNFESENKISKIYYGIYDNSKRTQNVSFMEHREIIKILEKKIKF